MKQFHTPRGDLRYWIAITLASVFGTNLGDLYAHESGLGIGKGLAVLAVLAAIVFAVERYDNKRHLAYYWLVIVLIRTGATNIADWLAYKVRVPDLPLTLGLAALIALFGFGTSVATKRTSRSGTLPPTNASYWLAMLSAGVFGTVLGDICQHVFGDGRATIGLTVLWLVLLVLGAGHAATSIAVYWSLVAVARTTGTAIGDWFAESKIVNLGLPLCTVLSGVLLLGVLIFAKSRDKGLLESTN